MKKDDLYSILRDPNFTGEDKKLISQICVIIHTKWIWTLIGGSIILGITWGTFLAKSVSVSDKVDKNEIKLETTCKQVNVMELALKGIETKQDMMIDLLKRRDK